MDALRAFYAIGTTRRFLVFSPPLPIFFGNIHIKKIPPAKIPMRRFFEMPYAAWDFFAYAPSQRTPGSPFGFQTGGMPHPRPVFSLSVGMLCPVSLLFFCAKTWE
jgi:hypothetical protein